MTSQENSFDISDEKVVQTLYVFAGKAGEKGAPVEQVHDSLMAPDLDSQVAKAVINELTSLRDQAHNQRRVARRYLLISPLLVLIGLVIAFGLQVISFSTTVSLIVAWVAVLVAIVAYVRGRALLQTRLA